MVRAFINPPKIKIHFFTLCVCVGGGVGGNQFSTFDAESKFAKIPKSHGMGGGGGGGGREQLVETNFQLLMQSPNLIKSKKKFTRGFAENFLVFGQKSAWEWFWTLSTKWLAYTKYTRITKKNKKKTNTCKSVSVQKSTMCNASHY